jgi:hypothetical protein
MKLDQICKAALLFSLFITASDLALGQEFVSLRPNVGVRFKIAANQKRSFTFEAKADDVCDISTNAPDDIDLMMSIVAPSGETVLKNADASEGAVFVAPSTGTYRLVFEIEVSDRDAAAAIGERDITATYSDKLDIPTDAVSKGVRTVNGYQAKIRNESTENGKTYLIIQKAGKIKAIMRAEKHFEIGFSFADEPSEDDTPEQKRSEQLIRTTPDKTGDGTPDIAVEYYTGGAHCCYEITFFELGDQIRQLPTIDSANDRIMAIAKRPGGGLRFEYAEQAFAYWTIDFADSPMPSVVYEFNKSDELVPRFDLMKKPAPSLAVLKRMATAAKAKINLKPYTSPDDNFNDFDEAFWGEMLDLIFTGHEDLAWEYFDMVWPAKKPGKAKFLADFKHQLSQSAYGDWQKMH